MTMHTQYEGNRTSLKWSNALWGDCPWNALENDPGMGFTYYQNFAHFVVADWAVTNSTAGSLTAVGAHGGSALLTSSATTAQGVNCASPGGATTTGSFVTPSASTIIWYETVVAPTTISTAPGFFAGLSTGATGLATTGVVNGTDYVGWYSTTSNQLLFTYKDAGGTQKLTSNTTEPIYIKGTTSTFTTGEFVKLGFKMEGLSRLTLFTNGVQRMTLNTTSTYPFPDALMNVCYGLISRGTVTPLCTLKWLRVAVADSNIATIAIS